MFFHVLLPKCPKWQLLGDTFPDMLQQRWKTENSGFVYTKHYFLEICGAGLGHAMLGSFFSRYFVRWFGEVILRFFEKLRVQPVAPRTSFGEHFMYKFCIDF